MPVTARLSKKFYDTLGEDIAQELVDWFNQVDATYRADLRELNELHFARFDAKLEQRLAEFRTELRSEIAELRGELRSGLAALRGDMRSEMAGLRAELKSEMAELRTELTSQTAEAHTEMRGLEGRFEKRLGSTKASLIKWMFLFWAGTTIPLIGIMLALSR